MARDFDGSNDDLAFTLNTAQKAITVCTFAFWIHLDSNAQYRRPFHFDAGTQDWRWEFDDSWGFSLAIPWTTAASGRAVWSMAKPATGSWIHVAFTYDGGSTSNDPIMYKNGVSQSVTERVAPSGSLVLPTGTAWIGSENGTGQFYNGRLAEFGVWNRILTVAEILALSKAFAPSTNPVGLVLYLDLLRDVKEKMGGAAITDDGTTAAVHPRIIYPTPMIAAKHIAIISSLGNYTDAGYTV
jgi:hypothetical protein